ncbi:Hypothetical protein PHPALM_447 [Phytophthora palmivora]|uniref:Uncharacterized protein n=1 Tax=Phytophthora palmivora TaxID=4796 RepID=A0A2P4YUT6_9STRA|nr:Hypothetical protein PHPALM_447 [Phytophthora palmivora]
MPYSGAPVNKNICAFFESQDEALHRLHKDFRGQYEAHHRDSDHSLQAFGFVVEETSHRYQ